MDSEDDRPKKKPPVTVGEKLDSLSVAELEVRLTELQLEIDRTREVLSGKKAGRAAADAFFKS